MEHLRQSDLRTLLNFLRNCYAIREFESFEQFQRHLVTALAQLISAQAAMYLEMDTKKSKSYMIGTQEYVEAPEVLAAWQRNMAEHPLLPHILRTGDLSARGISDFWSQRRYRNSSLYSEVFRRHGVEDDLGTTICPGPPIIGIAWHLDHRFTEGERLIANLAAPHINQAWQNAKLVSGMRTRLQLFEQGMESAALAAISCDSQGRIHFTTAMARRYLAEYFGVSRRLDYRLPDELLRWVRHQNAQPLESDVPPVRLPLTVEKASKRLTVRLLSSNGANLLLLEEDMPLPDSHLLSMHALSPRESEVLAWVAEGKTNGEIAAILSMNIGTVKKHLVNIFQKLGVETRTAAAARALTTHSPSE
jgi:DNA-binding CsgD family transcriptional regulator